tara:strand:+ start:3927 stop:5657 length:1731 start_codon:yes stop_codon:yes gene_type:complete
MRASIALVALMMTATVLLIPTSIAEAQNDGSTQTITSSEVWTSDATLDGDVVVGSGGVLTIDSNIDVATDSTITIEQGGSLILNGQLNALDSNNEVYMEVYQNTILEPYFSGLIDSGTLRVNMAKEYFTSMEVYVIAAGENLTWTGQSYLDFTVNFDDASVTVGFEGFWQFPVWVDSIQAFDSNGAIYTLDADEWNHNNGVLKTEEGQASFSIDIQGDLTSNGGTISDADIICSGSCTFANSTLSWSSPINVNDGAIIAMETSTMNGSRTYEDIIVHDTATIDFDTDSMSGTGGPTDMWIRLLSQRVITTNLKDAPASVHYEGLGYQASNGDLMLDANGAIDLGQNNNPTVSKYLRMTEWVDSSGVLHQESGMVMITLNGGTSVWNGDYSVTLNPAPTTPTYAANIALPYVQIDKVAPEDTQGTVDKGLGVMLTVTNSGTVDVATNIRCYEGVDEADMATMFVSLDAGQTKDIPAVWYANASGAKSLNCKASIPLFFNSLADDLTSASGTDSELVSFKEAEDREDAPIILYSAIVIVIIIATVIYTRTTAKKMATAEEKDYETEDIEDSTEMASSE